MKNLFLFGLLTFLLVACGNKTEVIDGTPAIWKLVSSENKSKKTASKDPLLDEAKNHEAGQKGLILCLFPDNRFTTLDENGFYDFGKWTWVDEGSRIQISGQKQTREWNLSFKKQANEQAELTLENDGEKQVWQRQAKMLEKFKEDEIYPDNNEWRIKPSKSETQEQILARLGNFFKHTAYLLKAADIRDVDVVSFNYADGVVKVYNSGIGVKDWEYVSEYWKNCFFNEEQAKTARLLFLNYLNNFPYHGTGSGDWVKDDYFLMLHIYNDLNEGKFDQAIPTEIVAE